jgi:CubicO group peptidase (beta-lactamase class C family)
MRRAMIIVGLMLSFSIKVRADQPVPESGAWDPNELRGFVDGVMEAQQKAQHFAGAVVVVVRGGQVVFQRGYGYADFVQRKPVDPERTLFRIASNSKTFVWTSVMQLVEKGMLDLHTDVNKYLKGFQIPPTFPQPITMEHLMTHTAGFEDHVIGLFAESPDKMLPLAELMRTQMPRRVFPPGQVPAYSNYGTTLAALIVEQVSGIPYERYLEDNLLKPLGMKHAALLQPLPKELAEDMSKGFQWSGGRLKEHPFEFVPWGPCGGMSVSGADMARFMIAHLNDGALGEARILRPETARLMRTRLASPYGMATGMLHGFFPMDWNGEKIYGHGGDTVWFHSLTAMMPERGLGVFVAFNTDSGAKARGEFSPAFFDHYFPRPLPKEPSAPKEKRASLERFSGTYFPARSSFSDVSKVNRLFSALAMTVDSDGYIVGSAGGETTRWRQIEPLMFQQVDGKRRIVFRDNDRGEITDFCASPLCVGTMQKQPWWDSPRIQYGVLITCLVALLGGIVGFPIAAVLQRKLPKPGSSKFARAYVWLNCLVWAVGFGFMQHGLQDAQNIVFGPTRVLKTTLNLWAAAAALTVASLLFVIQAWRRGWWRPAGRICLTLIVLGAIGCVLWLNHWNLLGWKY